MITLDMLGQPCPIPVVKAKNAIASLPAEGGQVQVLVDNQVACENLSKLASSEGCGYRLEQQSDKRFLVELTVGERSIAPTATASTRTPAMPTGGAGLVVAIGRNAMGHGSDELGQILIKGFIFSLTQLETTPKAVLFFNSGVKLTLKDANTVEDLQTLAAAGTKVLVCGTCADYFNCKDQVAAGEITNMYGIVEAMAGAANVINL